MFGLLMAGLRFSIGGGDRAYTDISAGDPSAGFAEHPEITAFLQGEPGPFRIDTRTGIEGLWQPDGAALHGLQDVGGIANPLLLQHWDALWESTADDIPAFYDMSNVEYVLAEDGDAVGGQVRAGVGCARPACRLSQPDGAAAGVGRGRRVRFDLPAAPGGDPLGSRTSTRSSRSSSTAPGDEPRRALPAELVASAAAPGGDAATVTAQAATGWRSTWRLLRRACW